MTEQKNSPAVQTMLVALDAVISEAVQGVIGTMKMNHVIWHKDEKSEPGNDCHTCVLIGLATPAEQAPSPIAMPNGGPQEVQPNG